MEYDIDPQEAVPEAVIYCVSVAENQSPTDLPPLYGTIDPDALEAIWRDVDDETMQNKFRVSFQYSNSHVTIENGQTITVEMT